MQRNRVAGRGLEDLAIEGLCVGELTGLVMGDRLLEKAVEG
jgi:hypothetical protein